MELPLAATVGSDVYTLDPARVLFRGVTDPTFVVAVDADGGETFVRRKLPPGEYECELLPGFVLNRNGVPVMEPVVVESANPVLFEIQAGMVTPIRFVIGVGGRAIGFGKGLAEVGIDVIDRTVCRENERVEGNVCVPCPPDTTNEAGDDATGPDTMCDDACAAVLGVDCDTFDEAYIKASNTNEDDFFSTVALSGDTLVVGALWEDSAATGINGNQSDNSAPEAGAVYVFVRTDGSWSQEAYLKASNAAQDNGFGTEVAVAGDTLAVGAPFEDGISSGIGGPETQSPLTSPNTGAVYVFTRSGGVWSQQAYVKASNPDPNDLFGFSVALSGSGDRLVVGATAEASNSTGINGDETDNSSLDAGAVYVFGRTGTAWAQEAYLKASNTDSDDTFGARLALSGNLLAVSAPGEGSSATGVNNDSLNNDAPRSGAVFLFRRTGGTWAQEAYVKASNTDPEVRFGRGLAVDGDTLVVGASEEGSAAVGIDGDEADNARPSSGAVYVFRGLGGVWNQEAYMKASVTSEFDNFGSGVSLMQDTLAVVAIGEDSSAVGLNGDQTNDDLPNSGAVYLFERSGSVWQETAYLKASNPDETDSLGLGGVALSGNTLAIGTSLEDSSATGIDGNQNSNTSVNSGAVYIRRIAP